MSKEMNNVIKKIYEVLQTSTLSTSEIVICLEIIKDSKVQSMYNELQDDYFK